MNEYASIPWRRHTVLAAITIMLLLDHAAALDRTPAGHPRMRQDQETLIRKALRRPVTFEFIERPLDEITTWIAREMKINVTFDRTALEDVGIGTDEPLTLAVKEVRLESALDLLLEQLDLTWTIRYEHLFITTPEEEETHLYTRVHDVSDLLVAPGETFQDLPAPGLYDYETLIVTIETIVAPDTWVNAGGRGSVLGLHGMLIFRQTRRVHEKVEALLSTLREKRARREEQRRAASESDELTLRVYEVERPAPYGGLMFAPPPVADGDDAKAESGEQTGGNPEQPFSEQLAALVVEMIEPESWSPNGGPGHIRAVPGAIAVKQTAAVHRQVARLFDRFRPSVRYGRSGNFPCFNGGSLPGN